MSKSKYNIWPSLRLYDQLGVPYVVSGWRAEAGVIQHHEWGGPMWTGHCMMLNANDSYGDAGFWHELAHWMVASPRQRRYPDYALGRFVNSETVLFTSSSTPHVSEVPDPGSRSRNGGWGEKTVALTTAVQQETWACHALQYYEPLVGHCGWDDAPTLNDAVGDFAGFNGPKFTRSVAQGCYKRFVEPLGRGTLEEVIDYTDRLKDK